MCDIRDSEGSSSNAQCKDKDDLKSTHRFAHCISTDKIISTSTHSRTFKSAAITDNLNNLSSNLNTLSRSAKRSRPNLSNIDFIEGDLEFEREFGFGLLDADLQINLDFDRDQGRDRDIEDEIASLAGSFDTPTSSGSYNALNNNSEDGIGVGIERKQSRFSFYSSSDSFEPTTSFQQPIPSFQSFNACNNKNNFNKNNIVIDCNNSFDKNKKIVIDCNNRSKKNNLLEIGHLEVEPELVALKLESESSIHCDFDRDCHCEYNSCCNVGSEESSTEVANAMGRSKRGNRVSVSRKKEKSTSELAKDSAKKRKTDSVEDTARHSGHGENLDIVDIDIGRTSIGKRGVRPTVSSSHCDSDKVATTAVANASTIALVQERVQVVATNSNSTNATTQPNSGTSTPVTSKRRRKYTYQCREISSYKIFVQFVRRDELGKVDASGILSPECYSKWIESRRKMPKKPQEAFRRALTAHCRGVDGRRPFAPEVEADLLKELRKKKQWKCFQAIQNCGSIGVQGFPSLGFHEKRSLHPEKEGIARTVVAANNSSANYGNHMYLANNNYGSFASENAGNLNNNVNFRDEIFGFHPLKQDDRFYNGYNPYNNGFSAFNPFGGNSSNVNGAGNGFMGTDLLNPGNIGHPNIDINIRINDSQQQNNGMFDFQRMQMNGQRNIGIGGMSNSALNNNGNVLNNGIKLEMAPMGNRSALQVPMPWEYRPGSGCKPMTGFNELSMLGISSSKGKDSSGLSQMNSGDSSADNTGFNVPYYNNSFIKNNGPNVLEQAQSSFCQDYDFSAPEAGDTKGSNEVTNNNHQSQDRLKCSDDMNYETTGGCYGEIKSELGSSPREPITTRRYSAMMAKSVLYSQSDSNEDKGGNDFPDIEIEPFPC